MDEMKIKGKFFEQIFSTLIKRYLLKNFGVKADVSMNDLDISMSDKTKISVSMSIDLEKSSTDIFKSFIKSSLNKD